MKMLKDNFIKFRVSEVEKQKYKTLSDELCLTVAGFVRWSANTQIRKYNKKQVYTKIEGISGNIRVFYQLILTCLGKFNYVE